LTGKTFDTFDGREWKDTDPSTLPDVTLDTLSLLASVDDYTGQSTDLVQKTTVQIRFRKINTAYVFAPLKAIATGSWASAARLKESGGDLMWPGVRSLHTEYTVPFYRINTDHRIFAEYLRTAEVPSYSSYTANAMMLAAKGEAGYSYEDLLRHREHIREIYGQPVELSEAIRAWLTEATADALTRPDRMERLEGLLRNLTYTVQPGELPASVTGGADFLDYFLRASREGYCSHFATAFVLLARAEGLPARYVQGYLVPVGGETAVTVRSSMAHAWPEVYYDGAGWIAYEPTPIYEVSSYWPTAEETGTPAAAGESRDPGRAGAEETVPLPEPEKEEPQRILIPWYAVAIPFAAGILVAFLLLLAVRLVGWIRFRRLDERERFVALCRRDLYLLRLLNLGIRETETLREYGARIAQEAGEENTRFLSFLEKQLYDGRYDLAEGEREASETGKRLAERLRKERPLRSIRARMQMGW
ncbi:MAG: transglutaminase domain-containing protein, partial [Lachnospiraceae bacterium]|nr:transglutaminase domain-containing protein [Lachnospiraceae bacterium]